MAGLLQKLLKNQKIPQNLKAPTTPHLSLLLPLLGNL
jgi:hypothetical protein